MLGPVKGCAEIMPVEKSAGKPGNGSPKPDGSRMQAASLSLEIFVIVVIG